MKQLKNVLRGMPLFRITERSLAVEGEFGEQTRPVCRMTPLPLRRRRSRRLLGRSRRLLRAMRICGIGELRKRRMRGGWRVRFLLAARARGRAPGMAMVSPLPGYGFAPRTYGIRIMPSRSCVIAIPSVGLLRVVVVVEIFHLFPSIPSSNTFRTWGAISVRLLSAPAALTVFYADRSSVLTASVNNMPGETPN